MVIDRTAESDGVSNGGFRMSAYPGRNFGFVIPILASVVAIAVSIFCYLLVHHQRLSGVRNEAAKPKHVTYNGTAGSPDLVPFVLLNKPDFRILHRNLESHRTETNQALRRLSQALEEALIAEESVVSKWKYSDHLRDKIRRLATIYEDDHETLEHIITSFTAKLMLTSAASNENDKPTCTAPNENHRLGGTNRTGFTLWSSNRARFSTVDVQPYETPFQVIAHLVRDWSIDGAPIRNSLYTWCVDQLQKHPFPNNEPILVPGAGLGRLAWELATKLQGCSVEAIEASLSMAAAAYSILNRQLSFSLHAYALDPFINEVDSSLRYNRVWIPDVDPKVGKDLNNFSFTVGEFNYEYMHKSRSRYSAVVTCFFLDTATTVYDYVSTIESVLVDGGLWVNVGPLHWHRNNQLPITVDELRTLLESVCGRQSHKPVFEILHWQVDSQPVNYRADGRLLSTHYDAYCPLRFVLRKKYDR